MINLSPRRLMLGSLLGLALAGMSLTPALAQAASADHGPQAHHAKAKKKRKKNSGTQVIVHCASVGVSCKGKPGPTGPQGPAGAAGAPGANGANVVLRARGAGGTEVSAESSGCGSIICGGSIAVSPDSWVEGPEEDDQLVGSVTITIPSETACGAEESSKLTPDEVILTADIDGKLDGISEVEGSSGETTVSTGIVFDLGVEALEAAQEGFGTGFFIGNGSSQTHVLTVQGEDQCKTAVHATVTNLAIDVLGTS